MEDTGADRAAPRSSFNVRFSKYVLLSRHTRLGLTLDALNVLNRASVNGESQASGPTFGQVTGIDAPRVLRFGASFSF
jgi:hypothetical protein